MLNTLPRGKKYFLDHFRLITFFKSSNIPNRPVNFISRKKYNLEPGVYSLQLSDILGRKLVEKNISINTGSHTETVSIPPKSSIGFYLVKIVNEKNKQVFSEKLMVKQLQ